MSLTEKNGENCLPRHPERKEKTKTPLLIKVIGTKIKNNAENILQTTDTTTPTLVHQQNHLGFGGGIIMSNTFKTELVPVTLGRGNSFV